MGDPKPDAVGGDEQADQLRRAATSYPERNTPAKGEAMIFSRWWDPCSQGLRRFCVPADASDSILCCDTM
jgi:hypothetical protein